MSKVMEVTDHEWKTVGWMIHCPACECAHEFKTGRWQFNGDVEKPTFSPSMLVRAFSRENIERDGWMPIMHRHKRLAVRVPFGMLDDAHAQRLHGGQSLKRLAERGGLSPYEALCHLDRVGLWDREPADEDASVLTARVAQWLKDVEASRPSVCHSFVRDGKIEFLRDCTHAMAGQTVELPEA